ncbi:VOC family protein [Erythrobacter sp. YT30]|uniref:VOC family protein n=1 Tax=Erythrobacter sp. YT30 TaxID=1735012 RepID=UPI000AF421E8|nr:VOC family protein [Erythrobacter sp. YT30]
MASDVVPDYQGGKTFYVNQLGFDLVEDTDLGNGKRWVVVGPEDGARILLAKATNDEQARAIGNQTGGRVAFFLETDNFADSHARFTAAGVNVLESPREESYGIVAVFSDPFGNRWDLIEPKA